MNERTRCSIAPILPRHPKREAFCPLQPWQQPSTLQAVPVANTGAGLTTDFEAGDTAKSNPMDVKSAHTIGVLPARRAITCS